MENLEVVKELNQEKESFKIKDLEGATWAFRKLRALESKIAEINAVAEKEKANIDRWVKESINAYEGDKAYFEGLLTEYYVEQKREDKKFKLTTPYGKVNSRKSKKWFYDDEVQLKEYIKLNGIEAIKVKEEIDKTCLKKLFKDGVNKETGEILPFVRIEEIENITVKVEE